MQVLRNNLAPVYVVDAPSNNKELMDGFAWIQWIRNKFCKLFGGWTTFKRRKKLYN